MIQLYGKTSSTLSKKCHFFPKFFEKSLQRSLDFTWNSSDWSSQSLNGQLLLMAGAFLLAEFYRLPTAKCAS
jgi:hypothetical protein